MNILPLDKCACRHPVTVGDGTMGDGFDPFDLDRDGVPDADETWYLATGGRPPPPVIDVGDIATVTVKIPADPKKTATDDAAKKPEKTWEQMFDEWMAKLKEKPEYALIGVAALVLLLKRK